MVDAPQRGFGAACHAGLLAATSQVVCIMDADSSLDPADLPLVAGPVLDGLADLVLGRRRPAGRGAWPLHARLGNHAIAAAIRRRADVQLRDLGPMRAARRDGLLALALADRRFGYPLEMVIRAAEAGWQIEERDVPYHPRAAGKSKVTGTVRGTLQTVARHAAGARGVMTAAQQAAGAAATPRAQVIVIAKQPVPGRVKTRLTPPFSPRQAARLAAAALADTLAAAAQVPAVRHVLALEGTAGDWLPPGFDVIAQHGRGLDERLAAAFGQAYAQLPVPMVLIGMDTPQVTRRALEAAIRPLATGAADAVFGPAADGGFWLLGLRRPDPALLLGVPMSAADTGEAQLARLNGAGLRVRQLPLLTDVDDAATARAVAAQIPRSRFAAALRPMLAGLGRPAAADGLGPAAASPSSGLTTVLPER